VQPLPAEEENRPQLKVAGPKTLIANKRA